MQDLGWTGQVKNGEQSGTVGLSKAIQSIKIYANLADLNVEYSTYVPKCRMAGNAADGKESTANDDPKRTGSYKNQIKRNAGRDLRYLLSCFIQAIMAGLAGQRMMRSQELKVMTARQKPFRSLQAKKEWMLPEVRKTHLWRRIPTVSYAAYVNGEGWMSPVENGETSGTTGKSLALGGIKVNLPDKGYAGTIQYMSHIQDIGWDSWKEEGEVSGTANGQKRLEAVKIRLTEEMEERYDIYYRVHAQNFGWMGWAKNGEAAGTEGYGYRVEAIQIKIVKKGAQAPGTTEQCFSKKWTSIVYSAHVQDIGWQNNVKDGALPELPGKVNE